MKQAITALAIAILLLATTAQAATVVKDGKEWLQPADFVNISWQEADAACPLSSARECTGLIGSIDVTGYIFASIAEVSALLATYGTPPPDHCGGTAARVIDSTWVPAIFADFSPTIEFGSARFLEGNVNDADVCAELESPFCSNGVGFSGIQSEVSLGDGHCIGEGSIPTGVWLYRAYQPEAVAIPSLGTYGLLITGFGLLLLATRRLSRRKAKLG